METTRRMMTHKELDAVISRLALLRNREGSPLMSLADPETTRVALRQMNLQKQIVLFEELDNIIGLLVFDVGYHWWSNQRILSELLVVCLRDDRPGFARLAIDQLEALAKSYQCKAIVAGCSFNKNYNLVTNSYKKKGFSMYCPSYIKMMEE